MKDQVTRFEKFIHENDAKRQRAELKAKQEAKQRLQSEERIKELQVMYEESEHSKSSLESQLAKLQRYGTYLDQVVEISEGEYDEIPDVLNR